MAPRCGCSGSGGACNCVVTAGDNVSVTGSGSVANPYVVSVPDPPNACYAPEMTRAAAIALRTSGSLVLGCPVLITDGPTIGTAGNTSPTTVLIWPVSATQFGFAAQVGTTYDNTAWAGTYDIDASGVGRIYELTDNRGNYVHDPAPSGTSQLQTNFPWGTSRCNGNTVITSGSGSVILTGWGNAVYTNGARVDNNRVHAGAVATTVILTGLTGGATIFSGNRISGSLVDISATSPNGMGIHSNEIVSGSTLTIPSAGNIDSSRISCGFDLNTGAFSNSFLVCDGDFTQTLTVANTNTGRNFLGSTLI